MTPKNDRQRQAEEAAKNKCSFHRGDASTYCVCGGFVDGVQWADSTPPQQEGDEEAAEKYTEERSVADYYNASIDNRVYAAFLRGAAQARRAQNAEIESLKEQKQICEEQNTLLIAAGDELRALLERAMNFVKSHDDGDELSADYGRMKGGAG